METGYGIDYKVQHLKMQDNIYEVVVVGAGLIGSAVAKYVSQDFPDGKTLLVGPGAGLKDFDHGRKHTYTFIYIYIYI